MIMAGSQLIAEMKKDMLIGVRKPHVYIRTAPL
jgi:hypothetical protein